MKKIIDDKTKYIIILAISLILILNISFIVSFLFKFFNINVNDFSFKDIAYTEVLMSLIITTIVVILYKKPLLKDWLLFNKNIKENIKISLKLFIILFGVKFLISFVLALLSLLFKIEITTSENQSIINSLVEAAPLMMLFSSVVMAPILEEIIFRLGFRKVIDNNYVFIIISGFTFGLIHVFPTSVGLTLALFHAVTYVSIGVLFGYFYLKYDNIFTLIVVHALNNLIGILAAISII